MRRQETELWDRWHVAPIRTVTVTTYVLHARTWNVRLERNEIKLYLVLPISPKLFFTFYWPGEVGAFDLSNNINNNEDDWFSKML